MLLAVSIPLMALVLVLALAPLVVGLAGDRRRRGPRVEQISALAASVRRLEECRSSALLRAEAAAECADRRASV